MNKQNTNQPKLILASGSAYRKQVLESLNLEFETIVSEADESFADKFPCEERPEKIARAKAEAVHAKIQQLPPEQRQKYSSALIIAADTLLMMNGKSYGKPHGIAEAAAFLEAFSGKTHYAVTAIVVFNMQTKTYSSVKNKTAVTFKKLCIEEIDAYLESGEWQGAAGGYRMQGLGACFITKIEGSPSCVAGLPISDFYDILWSQHYSILG